MNWEAIGAFGEIIGAIAVVLSLVYVGKQFRYSSTYALENIYFQTSNNFFGCPGKRQNRAPRQSRLFILKCR